MKDITLRPNNVPYKVPSPNSMGLMRYFFAFEIVVAHYNNLAGAHLPFATLAVEAVGGFFALSGFLVYGSYLRRREAGGHCVRDYLKARALRIMPAYFSVVLFFAIALSAVSSLPVAEYFGSWHFWRYLGANLCFANFLEPTLPGVFEGMEMMSVNGSLWTMKVECMLYLSVPVVAWLVARLRNRATAVLAGVYLLSAAWGVVFYNLYVATGHEVYDILGRQVFGQLCYFYSGVLVYYWYDVLMRHRWLVLAVALLCYLSVNVFDYGLGLMLRPLGLSVMIIILSMTGRWGVWEAKYENVSYNMYLIHWPLIQLAVIFGLPSICGYELTFAIVLASLVLLSVASVFCIERPIRRHFGSH